MNFVNDNYEIKNENIIDISHSLSSNKKEVIIYGEKYNYTLSFNDGYYFLLKTDSYGRYIKENKDISEYFEFPIFSYFVYQSDKEDYLFLNREKNNSFFVEIYKIKYKKENIFKKVKTFADEKLLMIKVIKKNKLYLFESSENNKLYIYEIKGL